MRTEIIQSLPLWSNLLDTMQLNPSLQAAGPTEDIQTAFVTKRELALIVERYLKDEKLDKTLQAFQQEQAKLIKNTRIVKNEKVKRLETIVNEYLVMRGESDRRNQFTSAINNRSRARATLEKLFDILEDRTPILNRPRALAYSLDGTPHYAANGALSRLDESQEMGDDDEYDEDHAGWESDGATSNVDAVINNLLSQSDQIADIINSQILGNSDRKNITIPDDVVDLLLPTALGPDSPSKRPSSAPSSPTRNKSKKEKRQGSSKVVPPVQEESPSMPAPPPKRRKLDKIVDDIKSGSNSSHQTFNPAASSSAVSSSAAELSHPIPSTSSASTELDAIERAHRGTQKPPQHVLLSETSLDALDVDALLARVNYGGHAD